MPGKKFYIPQCPGAQAPRFGHDQPWLAPMAGYSDLPFRLLCREHGATVCVTEMISARGLVYRSPGTGELLESRPGDQPLVVQLFGDDPLIMGQATRMLLEAGYRWFDCNMGCPARKVLKQQSGSRLLADPERAVAMARSIINAIKDFGAGGGAGFKLRIGLDEKRPMPEDLPLRLEDAGAAWLALHPRLASQGYTGQAHWEHIAKYAGRLQIPLLASGDLLRATDGIACMAQTGASGVMYARGALRNPFIFRQHLALASGAPAPALTHAGLDRIIRRHIALSRELRGDGALHAMRAIIPRYVRDLPGVGKLRLALLECGEWARVYEVLDEFMARNATESE